MEGRRETTGKIGSLSGTPRISRKGEGARYPGQACHATKVGGGGRGRREGVSSFLPSGPRQGGWAVIAPAFRRKEIGAGMELGAGIGPGETGEGNKGTGGSCVKGCLVLRWLIICGDWLQTIGSKPRTPFGRVPTGQI